MELLFLNILNRSITAGWLILAVAALRPFLKKAPRWISCVLWGLVAVRLLCPVSLESPFSLLPSAETISPGILTFADDALHIPKSPGDTGPLSPKKPDAPDNASVYSKPLFHSGIPALNSTLEPALRQSLRPESGSVPLHARLSLAGSLWLLILLCLLGSALLRYIKICRKVQEAVPLRDNVFLCDAVQSPFILGIIRPRIYLSSGIGEEEADYVLAHEQAHLKRRDHWWKLLGFILLAVYWFQPLCWAAYFLFCRDMELACDEKVIRDLNPEGKKAYSRALVSCSVPGRVVLSCPPAFGEIGIKERVKAVLHYKKPALWSILAACAACLAVALCFLTNPRTAPSSIQSAVPQSAASETIFFHGHCYKREDLSDETVEWLLWYSSLSEMEQYAISSIPGDLWELEFNLHKNTETAEPDTENAGSEVSPAGDTAEDLDAALQNAIFEENKTSSSTAYDFACCDFLLLDSVSAPVSENPGAESITCYGWALYQEYLFTEEGLKNVQGSHLPVAISFIRDENGYRLTEFWRPREGSYFVEDIRRKFPESIVNDAIDSQKSGLMQFQSCYDQAVREGKLDTDSIVESRLRTLSSDPGASSNPRDYLAAHANEYHELLYYGKYTLRYCAARFRKGGETGLEGKLMALICEELLQSKDATPADAAAAATGQEWYDTLRAHGGTRDELWQME